MKPVKAWAILYIDTDDKQHVSSPYDNRLEIYRTKNAAKNYRDFHHQLVRVEIRELKPKKER